LVDEWLREANSNLERARAGKVSYEIMLEDLCFDCQQTAEKALKALLIGLDIEFAKIHSIARLLNQIECSQPEAGERETNLADGEP
jgi:HEPN domain-containing protein